MRPQFPRTYRRLPSQSQSPSGGAGLAGKRRTPCQVRASLFGKVQDEAGRRRECASDHRERVRMMTNETQIETHREQRDQVGTVIQTNRAAGWQDVFHLHMHLVPRWDTDTLVRPWTPEAAQSSDLAAVAAQLQTRR